MRAPDNYADLSAIVTLCLAMAGQDGTPQDCEIKAIFNFLKNTYDYGENANEKIGALVKEALNADMSEVSERVSNLDDDVKQFASDFVYEVMMADETPTQEEIEGFNRLQDSCGLPLPTPVQEYRAHKEKERNVIIDEQEEEVAAEVAEEEVPEETAAVIPCIRYTSMGSKMLDGELELLPVGEDVEEEIFDFFDNPKNLQFWRTSEALDLLNAKLDLPKGLDLIMIYFKPGLFASKDTPNKCGTLVAGKSVTGPVVFALEDQDETVFGFTDKALLKSLLEGLDILADHTLLTDGNGSNALAAKNLQLAYDKIENL